MTEAREILSNVAKLNGKEMPEEEFYLASDEQNERLGDFRDLFKSPRLIHKTLGSWLMWYVHKKIKCLTETLTSIKLLRY